jgi:uncharacterized protein (TIGR02147 family)
MKSLFECTNYRCYLKDFFQEKKSESGYTHRDFARAAGVNSPSWLSQLIKGRKNLTTASTIKVCKALKLNKKEAEYFELLVEFTQAKTNEVKDHFYKKMIELKKKLGVITINEEQYEFYTRWYHPVIRSLVSKVDFGDDYAVLARKVLPAITPAEAKKSVQFLERTGFIKRDKNGKWIQTKSIMTTGDEVSSLKIVNYHKEVSKLAAEAHDRSPKEKRDISALTVGINEKDFSFIKSEIQTFRKKILQVAQNSKKADRVYQLNFQFFPVSREG